MKRIYIIPAIKVRNIKPTTVLAGSDITIAGGGESGGTQPETEGTGSDGWSFNNAKQGGSFNWGNNLENY